MVTQEVDEATARAIASWLGSYESANTQAAYRRDIDLFVGWCAEHRRIPLAVSVRDVARYFSWSAHEHASGATRARRMASLESFFRFAEAAALVASNPVATVARPALDKTSRTSVLTDGDAAALLKASDEIGAKAAALVRLLMLDGLRLNDALDANVSDFRSADRTLAVERRGRRGVVPLCAPTVLRLDRYLDGRRRGPLLLSDAPGQRSARLTRFGADYLIKRTADAAEVDANVSANALRRRYVTAAVAAGRHLDDIRDQSGQQDLSTTRRYLQPQPTTPRR